MKNVNNVKMVKLGDVCRVVSGATPRRNRPEFWGKGINWVTPKDLSKLEETTLYKTPEQITQKGLASCSTEVLPVKSVLFSSRAPIGLIALTGAEMCTNQGFKSLIPFDGVDGGYLYWCMKCVTPQIIKQGRGATFKEVSKKQMEDFEIPFIDDPDEQKRIAEILDLADEARRNRLENLKLYDDLIRSLFLQTFGDPVSNPMGWVECELQFHADIKSGVTKGRKFGGKRTVMAPYMRVANVQDGHLNLDDIAEVEVLPEDVEKYRLIKDDILLTEGGDPDKLGRGAIWKGTIENCIHQNHIFRVRLDKKLLNPEYASILISSPRGKRYFLRAAKQTTGIASINMGQLKKCPMLLPPITLQNVFAEQVTEINSQKAREQALYKQHDDLFNSLLQRAFKGEL